MLEHNNITNILHDDQKAFILANSDIDEINSKLLDVALDMTEDHLESFLSSLADTGHQHVVNFIKSNGGEV